MRYTFNLKLSSNLRVLEFLSQEAKACPTGLEKLLN